MKTAFALSIALHGVVAAALLLLAGIPEDPPASIELVRVTTSPAGSVSPAPSQGGAKANKPRLNLGLAPKGARSESLIGEGRSSKEGNSGVAGGSDAYDAANSMGLSEEAAHHPFFDVLWRRIDAATHYPEAFRRQRLSGTVTAQIVVRRDGTFTGKLIRLEAESSLLKTYTMAVLIHALSKPLPENLWAARKEMPVAIRFDFELIGTGEFPKANDPAHFKNVLAIRRHAYVDPILNEKINEIVTRFVPPIIPIPGGFFVDFIRLYQFIENWGKADSKTADEIEVDALRRKWQETIRAETVKPD